MDIKKYIQEEAKSINIELTNELLELVLEEIMDNVPMFIRKCQSIVGFNKDKLQVGDWITYNDEPYKVIETSETSNLARIQSIVHPNSKVNIHLKSPVGIIKKANG